MIKIIIRIFKWIIIAGLAFIVFMNIWAIINTYRYEDTVDKGVRGTQQDYSRIINTVLGIPYYDCPGVITDSTERIDMSVEEWMNLKCNMPNHNKTPDNEKPYFYGNEFLLPSGITNQEVDHLNCIGIESVWEYAKKEQKDTQKELCNNVFVCKIINLATHDYILAHPRILKNALRVMENPCKYIKQVGEGEDEYENYLIQSLRNSFECDSGGHKPWFKNERILTILTIWSEEFADPPQNRILGEFIVRRQDLK